MLEAVFIVKITGSECVAKVVNPLSPVVETYSDSVWEPSDNSISWKDTEYNVLSGSLVEVNL